MSRWSRRDKKRCVCSKCGWTGYRAARNADVDPCPKCQRGGVVKYVDMTKAQEKKAAALITASMAIHFNWTGDSDIDEGVVGAVQEYGYSILKKYGCAERSHELLETGKIVEMIKRGEI